MKNKRTSTIKIKSKSIHIPQLGEIIIGVKSVPTSGATVSVEKLASEFRDAARRGTIPLPPSEHPFNPAV